MIQDGIIMFCQVGFAITTLPVITSDKKPPLITSLLSSVFLFTMGGTFLSLGLPAGAAMAILTGLLWCVVAVQTITPAAKLAWKHRG